jgi:hypothetical protein
MRQLLSFTLLCLSASVAHAQAPVPCPPNIDFEVGLSSWNYYIGTCCPLVAETPTAPIACRHTLTTTAGLSGCTVGAAATDQYGGFPIVAPGGGAQSLRLGDLVNGAGAEKARYYFTVPSGTSSYSLIYRYAVVFQNPSHAPAQQPRFETNAFDTTSGWAPVTGAHHTYVAGGVLPGFITNSTCTTCVPAATAGQPVQYKNWSTASIDLTGLAGHVVAVDFMNGDCTPGGHFSYAYVDVSCGLFEIEAMVNCDTSWTMLTAPPGYESYTWYDAASFTTPYSNGWVPVSAAPASYAVVLQPYPGFGPADTLYTSVSCPTTGLPTGYSNTSVRLYPNPAGNTLSISMPGSTHGTVTITNALGSVVMSQQFTAATNHLDIHSLPPGIYFANIQTADGTTIRRFLKEQ